VGGGLKVHASGRVGNVFTEYLFFGCINLNQVGFSADLQMRKSDAWIDTIISEHQAKISQYEKLKADLQTRKFTIGNYNPIGLNTSENEANIKTMNNAISDLKNAMDDYEKMKNGIF